MGSRKRKVRKRNKKRVTKYLSRKKAVGRNLIDRVIDKIPFELHVPSYQFCGPGTHLTERLKRGDSGINPLDAACRVHDIAYHNHKDSKERSIADGILQKEAIKRIFANDSTMGEKAVALGVAAAMGVKRKLSGKGVGLKCNGKTKKKVSFGILVKNAKLAIKNERPDDINSAIKIAMRAVRKHKIGKYVRHPRTIKLPNIKGGFLPLIPIFAGLSALGSIVGSSAAVINAIKQTKRAQLELEESKRHNKTMEEIEIANLKGKGYFLRSPKGGKGYFLSQNQKNL